MGNCYRYQGTTGPDLLFDGGYRLKFRPSGDGLKAALEDTRSGSPVCPVCMRHADEYDVHHWVYGEDERVVRVCEKCHREVLHEYGTVSELRELAAANGDVNGWRDIAVKSAFDEHLAVAATAGLDFDHVKKRLALPDDYTPGDWLRREMADDR